MNGPRGTSTRTPMRARGLLCLFISTMIPLSSAFSGLMASPAALAGRRIACSSHRLGSDTHSFLLPAAHKRQSASTFAPPQQRLQCAIQHIICHPLAFCALFIYCSSPTHSSIPPPPLAFSCTSPRRLAGPLSLSVPRHRQARYALVRLFASSADGEKKKLVFLGTPGVAAIALEHLITVCVLPPLLPLSCVLSNKKWRDQCLHAPLDSRPSLWLWRHSDMILTNFGGRPQGRPGLNLRFLPSCPTHPLHQGGRRRSRCAYSLVNPAEG